MHETKKEFLLNQIWINSWSAASQRSNIYPKNMQSEERKSFKDSMKKEVIKIFEDIEKQKSISEDKLIEKIKKLEEYGKNINDNHFNIGHSQKLINLMLKYYWCMGWLKKHPPHCPVDRTILEKAKVKENGVTPAWTKINNIEKYKTYIKEIKEHAKPDNIPQWELEIFNDNRKKQT